MKIIITESQYDYLRRIPAVEDEVNKVLQFVNPTEFIDFQDYISHVTKKTLLGTDVSLLMVDEYGDLFYKRFRDHIMYNLRDKIKKIYNSKKPGGFF